MRKSKRSKSTLILLDVDDTLIVNGFQLYKDNKIINRIYGLQHEGVYVGIVTNRSAEMAQTIYNDLHLNGPFLVELGANLVFENYKTIKKRMMNIRLVIVKCIIRFYAAVRRIDIELSNKRRYTISIFASNISNINKINLIVGIILKIFSGLTSTVSFSDCRIYIRDKNITKHSAVKKLSSDYANICVIGDAEHDAISDEIHYLGVCNSQRYYSMICEYSTKKSGVSGIIDLLEYVRKHIK